MNFKKLALALSLTAAFTYMGCDDSSTAPATGGDDQPTLSSSSAGEDVDEPAAASSDSKADSADSVDSADPGDVNPASSADVGPSTIPGIDSSFTFDSTAFADMMKCDEEGATKNMMGAAVMVCKNGQWEYDSTATAEANKCDEDGATKTETMDMGPQPMELTYICKDGQWEMQIPDFSGMFSGDSTGGFNWNMGDSTITMPGGNWNLGDSTGKFIWGDSSFTGIEIPTPVVDADSVQ